MADMPWDIEYSTRSYRPPCLRSRRACWLGTCTSAIEWLNTVRTSGCLIPGRWGPGLFELRLKSGEGIGRVFYCTPVERRVVMLHQFVKKTEKTPPKELSIARKRMKERKDADA